jgi:hypothetical protein
MPRSTRSRSGPEREKPKVGLTEKSAQPLDRKLQGAVEIDADDLFPQRLVGIEKVGAELDSAVNGGDYLPLVARAVKLRHAHAAQAQSGNREAAASKLTSLHDRS